jgi:hypothetical protein
MNEKASSTSADPLGLRADLRLASSLADRDQFDDEEDQRAAYQLAAALGRCRLFGVDLGEDDETLAVPVALAAVRQWLVYAEQWRRQAKDLPQRWDAASSEIEADSLCFDLLEARMESWAVFVAVDEAYEECLHSGDPGYGAFVLKLDRMMEEMDELDAALIEQKDLLCVAAGTCLLKNWKQLLSQEYADTLPWWLDGALEAVHQQLLAEATATMSNSAEWRLSVGGAEVKTQMTSQPVSQFRRDLQQVYASLTCPEEDKLTFLATRFDQWRARTREALDAALKTLPLDDPLCCPISLFRTMDYGRLETAHTRSLAWMLDPQKEHGFGATLLAALLRHLSQRAHVDQLSVRSVESERATYSSDDPGRLDVFAEGECQEDGNRVRWVLAIEAKINAWEGEGQLDKYDRWLDAYAIQYQAARVFRVFLTPTGRPPEGGGDEWESLSFLELVRAFRKAYGALRGKPGFHLLRFYLAGVLQDVCGWPSNVTADVPDPYAVLSYLNTFSEAAAVRASLAPDNRLTAIGHLDDAGQNLPSRAPDMTPLGKSLVFYLKYAAEMDALFSEPEAHKEDLTVRDLEDADRVREMARAVSAVACEEAADFLELCANQIADSFGSLKIGASKGRSKRATIRRSWGVKAYFERVPSIPGGWFEYGVVIWWKQNIIVPWLWRQGGRAWEELVMQQLGPRAHSRSGEGLVFTSGAVALGRIPILPNDLSGFDVNRDPLVEKVVAAFKVIQTEDVKAIARGVDQEPPQE